MKKQWLFISVLLLCSLFSAIAQLNVVYKCGEPRAESPMIKPHIMIVNNGAESIPLRELKIRYFYTNDGADEEHYLVEYAVIGSQLIKLTFAYGYVDITFTPQAMVSIAPGGNSGEILIRINRGDWNNYNQADDFSFDPSLTDYRENQRIALFRNGNHEYGYEYYPEPSPTRTPD